MCYGKTRSSQFTTCTVERSFSTLRRVKTWTRSTKEEYRLDLDGCVCSAFIDKKFKTTPTLLKK